MTVDDGENRAVTHILNDLIVMNRGIINVYETAADQLHEEENRKLVLQATKTHELLAEELSSFVSDHGGKAVTGEGPPAMLKKAWIGVKGILTDGDGPILADVAQEADKILAAYGEAMGAELPEDARTMVRKHLSQARLLHKKLVPLSAVYS